MSKKEKEPQAAERNNKEIVEEINYQTGALESGAHTQDVGDLADLAALEVPNKLHSGRPLPPVEKVVDATEVPGAHQRCVKQQVGENRYPINSAVERDKGFGPNN